jgi:hypothetical protein
MATISSQMKITDGISRALQGVISSVNTAIGAMEQMHQASNTALDATAFRQAHAELETANPVLKEVGASMETAQKKAKGVTEQTEQTKDAINGIGGAATAAADGGMEGMLKKAVSIGAAMAAIRKGFLWGKESLALADTQMNAETQLKNVLRNAGAQKSAFGDITTAASGIQSKTMYGDEAMIGGAAELGTYIKDADAIKSMMGTLSNYAAGMSGGVEVNYQQMVEYATQLGKALDGTYDGLRKKGFQLSDSQKEMIETGSDMQKALVIDDVISQSWKGLAEQMSNTPSAKILQMKNAWGDVREEFGKNVYPGLMQIIDTMNSNMPYMKEMILGLGTALGKVMAVAAPLISGIGSGIRFISENIKPFLPVLGAIAGIIGMIAAAYAVWTTVTHIQAAAQAALNFVTSMNPAVWIIALIIGAVVGLIALIALIIGWVKKAHGETSSALGNILQAVAYVGAAIWNIVAGTINTIPRLEALQKGGLEGAALRKS